MSATISYTAGGTSVFSAPTFTLDDPVIVVSAGAIGAVVALIAAFFFVRAVLAEEEGNPRMRTLRRLIYEGASARSCAAGARRLRAPPAATPASTLPARARPPAPAPSVRQVRAPTC